jgi:lipopolysaccharide export system protein LptA
MTARQTFAAFLACAGAAGYLLHAAEQQVGAGRLNADEGAFDLKEGFHHFQGHVQFRYPGVIDLDCDDLKIRLLPGGRQIDRLIASNNVVLSIIELPSTNSAIPLKAATTNRVHAAVAIYNGTNDLVTLSGSPEWGQPWVERAEGSFKADEIVFDRANDRLSARGNFQMIIVPDALPKDAALAPKPAR